MRMWMAPPERMCRKHLLGEHVETHMLLGSLKKGKKIDGFLKKRLVEPSSLHRRHEELAREMTRRGFAHRSPMGKGEVAAALKNLGEKDARTTVDSANAAAELARRCPECSERASPV